jgi:hypothetical protein
VGIGCSLFLVRVARMKQLTGLNPLSGGNSKCAPAQVTLMSQPIGKQHCSFMMKRKGRGKELRNVSSIVSRVLQVWHLQQF